MQPEKKESKLKDQKVNRQDHLGSNSVGRRKTWVLECGRAMFKPWLHLHASRGALGEAGSIYDELSYADSAESSTGQTSAYILKK